MFRWDSGLGGPGRDEMKVISPTQLAVSFYATEKTLNKKKFINRDLVISRYVE